MSNYLIKTFIIIMALSTMLSGCDSNSETANQSSQSPLTAEETTPHKLEDSSPKSKTSVDSENETNFQERIDLNHDLKVSDSFETNIQYTGKGTVILDSETEGYSYRFPYLEESSETSEIRLMMRYVMIHPDSIAKYELKDGAFIDIEGHCVASNDNKALLVIDSCSNTDAAFLQDMYESASLESLPSKKAFDEFRRYGEEGTMCKLTLNVLSTFDYGYACTITYPDYDDGSVFLYDELNGKGHVRILPKDVINVLCRFDRMDDDGRPIFDLDYIIDVSGVGSDSNNDVSNISTESIDNEYVYSEYKYDDDGETIPEFYAYVNAPDGYVNLRTGPGTEYDIICSIENGEAVEVYKNGEAIADNGKKWLKIAYWVDGGWNTGYVIASQMDY